MIAICSAFRRPSGSMRTIDIAAVIHRKEAHEEKTEDHYHGHAGEVFPELARTSIATDRFVLLSRPSSTHKIISRKIACCSAVFFMPAKKGPVCGRLTSTFLAEAFRPTPVSRERSTAVSPAGPQSDPCGLWPLVVESLWLQWPVAAGCGKPVAALGATYQPCAAHAGEGIRCC